MWPGWTIKKDRIDKQLSEIDSEEPYLLLCYSGRQHYNYRTKREIKMEGKKIKN